MSRLVADTIRPESCLQPENEAENAPPDGGYGWVCVASCFTINFFTWGVVAVNLTRIFIHSDGLTNK